MKGNGNGKHRSLNVGIFIFNEVEVLDFAGPYEVFAAVRLEESLRRETLSPFRTVLIAQDTCVVRAQGGLRVLPDYPIDRHPSLDVLIVPGGWGTRREIDNFSTMDWLREQNSRTELICGVCTGSALLARAGLLEGKRATTHSGALEWLRRLSPGTRLEEGVRVVKEGNVWTSGGISAGIDLALEVVQRFYGEPVTRATIRHMEYLRFSETHPSGWSSSDAASGPGSYGNPPV